MANLATKLDGEFQQPAGSWQSCATARWGISTSYKSRLLKNPYSAKPAMTKPQAYLLYVEDFVIAGDKARREILAAC
ncbi:MAG: hypothetical protein ACYC0N_03540 [Carboxydocellales bacterium]